MKVLIVCGAGIVSGKEIMSLKLMDGLQKKGHQCVCITASWGSLDFRERLKGIGVRYYVQRLGFVSKTFQWSAISMTLHQLLYLPVLGVTFIRTLIKEKPDVILHTNFHHLFLLFPILPLGVRNIYWAHEIMSNRMFYKILFRLFSFRVDRFIAVSEAVAAPLVLFAGKEKVKVIRNGIDVQEFERENESPKLAWKISIVGQIARHKGHEVLFQAVKKLKPAHFEPVICIVGEGDEQYVNYLVELSREMAIDDRIEWRGFQRGLQEIYKYTDLVVLPSVTPDPFPTTIIECGLLGIPVIASAIGGIPEMIEEGCNGYTFEAGNSTALADVLGRVLESDLTKLSLRAKAYATEHFSGERFIENFEGALLRETST